MSFHNSFDILNSSAGIVPQSSKKKKSKPAKAASQDAAGPNPAPPTNGAAKQRVDVPAATGAAPAVFSPGWTDSRGAGGKVVSGEALSASLEDAAKTTVAMADKLGLWKDWVRQAFEGDGRYAKDGRTLSFQQVFQESTALEITLENCLKPPMDPSSQGDLQALLVAFLPKTCGKDAPKMLANVVGKLATALADETEDIVFTAQRSLSAAVATLKASAPSAEELIPKLQEVDRQTTERATKLKELEVGEKKAKLGERTRCSAELLKLCETKLDLVTKPLMKNSSTGASLDPNAAIQSLQDLGTLVDDRLKQARQIANMYSAGNAEKALASVRQQEAQLAQQAANLAAEILATEARLKGLRMQAAQIEVQRSLLTKSTANSGKIDGDAARSVARRHEQQLQSIRGLETVVIQHCNSISSVASQTANSKKVVANAPTEYLNALEGQLKYKNLQQMDMLVRLQGLQRQSMFKVNDTELRALGMEKEQAQMAQKLRNMVKDVVASAETLSRTVDEYKAALHNRARTFPPQTVPSMQRINGLLDQLQKGHATILAEAANPTVPKQPALESSTPAQSTMESQPRAAEATVAVDAAPSTQRKPEENRGNQRKPNQKKPEENRNSNNKIADGVKEPAAAAPSTPQRSNQKAAPKQTAPAPAQIQQPSVAQPSNPAEPKEVAEPAPAIVVPAKPTRGWGKVDTAPSTLEVDESLPTPAEALSKAAAGRKKNNPK
uniref:Uncharacterized protein n=1 Tax=Pyramimonas obovata TaxID=1411642 RepID=A0A7S0NA50_9CHLO